jgi:hypothetical protein
MISYAKRAFQETLVMLIIHTSKMNIEKIFPSSKTLKSKLKPF